MDTQLTIRLPTTMAERLKQYADRLGLKRADLARLALQQLLGLGPRSAAAADLYQRVFPLLGTIQTGLTDLGQRHREHLRRKLRRHA